MEEPTTKVSKVYLGFKGVTAGDSRSGGAVSGREPLGLTVELHHEGPMAEVIQGFGDHRQVVLEEPFTKLGVGHPDPEDVVPQGHERGGAEPGGKAMPVDLLFDPGQRLVPDIHKKLRCKYF